MAVDVSRIPNNNKFDPVREAILQLQTDVQSGVSGVGSINGQDGLITITNGSNITVGTVSTTITIGLTSDISITNATLSGYLRGPATFVIDPAAHGDDTGTVVIAGNLQVDGTTTTINSTTLTVDDKNIVLASGAANATAADGAGITIDGADATMTYNSTSDRFVFDKHVQAEKIIAKSNSSTITLDPTLQTSNYALTIGITDDGIKFQHNSNSRGFVFDRNGTELLNIASNGNSTFFGNVTAPSFIGDLDGSADQVDGLDATDFTLDYVTDNNNTTTNTISIGGADITYQDDNSKIRLQSGAFADANDRYEILATGEVMFLQYWDNDQGDGSSLQKPILGLKYTGGAEEATLFGDLRLKSGNVASPTYDAVVLDLDKVNGHVDITNVRNGTFSGDLTATTNLIVGTTNVYDALPTGLFWDDTDDKFKIGVTANGGNVSGGSLIQPLLLANILNEGYIPYVATGGGGSSIVNSRVSDSWLKLTSDTLELGASDPVSHEIRYARFLWQAGSNDKISTVYGAKDITASIQYLGGSTTAKIEFTGGSGGGRIKFNDEYTFPTTDGTSGQVLSTNGSGDLSWVAAGGPTTSDLQDVTDNGATTTNAIEVGGNIQSLSQIRAGGWYNVETGAEGDLAFEIGVSGGEAYALSYNRGTASYGDMNFAAVNFNFDERGGTTTIKNNEIWHAGNDGAGSGLDADKLDNKHATDFNLQYVTDNGSNTTNSISIDTSSGIIANFETNVADQLGYIRVWSSSQSSDGINTGAGAIELIGKAGTSTHGRHAWIGAEGIASETYRTKLKFKVRGETNLGYTWSGANEAPTILTLDGEGRAGVNTSSPAIPLHVVGAIGTQNGRFFLGNESGTTNDAVEFYKSGNNVRIYVNDSAFGGTYNAGSANLELYSGTSYATKISGNGDSYFAAGDVGIGTTSPQAPLHVIAASTADDALIQEWSYNQNDQDKYSLMLKQTVTSGVVRYNFSMVNNNTAYNDVLVLDRGKVGIGVTSPHAPLVVNGYIDSSDITNGAFRIYNGSTFRGGWGTADWAGTAFGNSANDIVALTNGSNSFIIGTNSQPRIWVEGNGEVGVGTTTPQSKFHVHEPSDTLPSVVTISNDVASGDNNISISQIRTLIESQTKEIARIEVKNASDSHDDGNIVFSTMDGYTDSFANRMIVNARGVSIIDGEDRSMNASGEGQLEINGSGYTFGIALDASAAHLYHNSSSRDLVLGTNEQPRLTIKGSDGDVGIGTSSPQDVLNIHNTSADANIGFKITRGSQTHGLRLGVNNTHAFLWTTEAQDLAFATSNEQRLTITSGGDIGINTTSPRYQLDLAKPQDTSQVDYIALGVKNGPSTGIGTDLGSGLIWKANYTGYTKRSAGIVQIAEGNYFRSGLAFYTNGTANSTTDWVEAMRINQNQNVGIGTNNPLNKLSVVKSDTFGYYDRGDATVVIQDIIPTLLIAHDGNSDDEYAEIKLGNNHTTYYQYSAFVRGVQGGGINQYRLEFGTANFSPATTKMTLHQSGNLVVGNGSAYGRLNLDSSQANASDYVWLVFNNLGSGYGDWNFYKQGNNNLAIGYGTTAGQSYSNAVTFEYGGNVGIDAPNPSHRLHVHSPSDNTYIARFEGSTNNAAGVWTGIGIGGESNNTKSAIIFEDIGVSYSRGKLHLAVNNEQNQNSATKTDAKLTVNNDGNVGINDTTPSYQLDVNGTIRATGDVIAYSDARVKENVKTIDNALDKVTQLRGVSYNKIGETEEKIGVIAQEIEKVLPQVVQEDAEGMKSVAYGNIVGVLIESIKELKQEIDELKARLDA